MADRPRSRSAKIRASHGRAERLRREAGDTRQPKAATPRQSRTAARSELTPQPKARSARAVARERKPTPLHRIQERLERSQAAAERQRLQRLERQFLTGFNAEAERRRDAARRAEFERKREALQEKARRVEEHLRRANMRRLQRKRDQLKREFVQAADRRRAAARRMEHDRVMALAVQRQKELERRAAAEIEREQKRRAADQQAAQHRQRDAMRARQKGERDSFRVNEITAMERHHGAMQRIDAKEERELADFDGRRRGLAGRAAELIPGRRAEMDRRREEMVRGYESERLTKHRELEAYKERAFEREMKTRLDHARELKELRAMHRDERDSFGRNQADMRPQLVTGRVLLLERTDRTHEEQREQARAGQARENVRPSEDFARSASESREPSTARDHAADRSEVNREAAHDIFNGRVMERA